LACSVCLSTYGIFTVKTSNKICIILIYSINHIIFLKEDSEIGSPGYWRRVRINDKVVQKNYQGYQFLKAALNRKDSFNYPSRSTEERLLQYNQFIRIYNSLNIGEKINTSGNASTLKSQIIKKVLGFNYLLRLADRELSNNLNRLQSLSQEEQVPPEAQVTEPEKHASVSEGGQVPPEAQVTEPEKQASVSEGGQVPPDAQVTEPEKQASVSEGGQVPPDAQVTEPEKQASVSEGGQVPREIGQVPPEAEMQESEKQASVSEEGQVPREIGQVPPEAEMQESEKQVSVSDQGQVPPDAEVQGPKKVKSGQVQQMLETPQEFSTGVQPTTNQDPTVTGVIVEGISRFLRDGEGDHLLRGDCSDSSYNLSNVQDQSWNEDSDDDQDDNQGIDSEKN
jgi:hypothetical protein